MRPRRAILEAASATTALLALGLIDSGPSPASAAEIVPISQTRTFHVELLSEHVGYSCSDGGSPPMYSCPELVESFTGGDDLLVDTPPTLEPFDRSMSASTTGSGAGTPGSGNVRQTTTFVADRLQASGLSDITSTGSTYFDPLYPHSEASTFVASANDAVLQFDVTAPTHFELLIRGWLGYGQDEYTAPDFDAHSLVVVLSGPSGAIASLELTPDYSSGCPAPDALGGAYPCGIKGSTTIPGGILEPGRYTLSGSLAVDAAASWPTGYFVKSGGFYYVDLQLVNPAPVPASTPIARAALLMLTVLTGLVASRRARQGRIGRFFRAGAPASGEG